ncbi:hypothetical protein [Neobacillus fumarioli]|uniref:hypothetical protein n=1 Tax=Neobacillus fumarioli TaxID=105229 RepID=UPI00082A8B4C|nr:hypothetical protein [Neobacillus fumarioli]
MEHFLWAIGSLVILVPVIYFLPIGISKIGKWMIISLSFLFGVIGLFAQTVLPLWEFVILLFVLIGLIAYILDRKVGKVLYVPIQSIEEEPLFFDQMNDDVPGRIDSEERTMTDIEMHSRDHHLKEIPIIENTTVQAQTSDANDIISKEKSLEMKTMLEDWEIHKPFDMENEFQPIADQINKDQLEVAVTEDYLAELEDMVNEAIPAEPEEPLHNMLTEELEHNQTVENSFFNHEASLVLAELDPLEAVNEQEKPVEDHEEMDGLHLGTLEQLEDDLSNGQLLSFEESATIASEELKNDGQSLSELDQLVDEQNIDLFPGYEESAANTNEEIESMDEAGLVSEHIPSYEEVIPTVTASQPDVLKLVSEQDAEDETNKQSMPNPPSGTPILQRKIIHTIVTQLKIVRKTMNPEDYEQLILKQMNVQLSVHEHFTFASMLMEHYIAIKDFGKLESLIDRIKEKIAGYPILEQQVEFIHGHYCRKNH